MVSKENMGNAVRPQPSIGTEKPSNFLLAHYLPARLLLEKPTHRIGGHISPIQFQFSNIMFELVGHLAFLHSVKGGGAKKMLQTAKTFVTKLVRYIEWIVDPLRGHQFYLIWYCYGQKRPFFWPKPPFLAMRGSRRPRWLAKVDQMVDHS